MLEEEEEIVIKVKRRKKTCKGEKRKEVITVKKFNDVAP